VLLASAFVYFYMWRYSQEPAQCGPYPPTLQSLASPLLTIQTSNIVSHEQESLLDPSQLHILLHNLLHIGDRCMAVVWQ
jgi:hypothetical protein